MKLAQSSVRLDDTGKALVSNTLDHLRMARSVLLAEPEFCGLCETSAQSVDAYPKLERHFSHSVPTP